MMFAEMTYEKILERILNRITAENPNLDIREGSIIYNAVAPCAMELAIAYTEIENVLNESFVGTASREYILKKCEEQGMNASQFGAHAGTFKGEFDAVIAIGSRWNLDTYNYTVTEYIGKTSDYFEYLLTCETAGSAPNGLTGNLIPIGPSPPTLTHAVLTGTIVEGENDVEDDDIRIAYFNYVNSAMSDGNLGQYQQWCEQYSGIGNYRITPLWNGANTVKVSILSASNQVASAELVEEFQAYLDPGSTGMGDGVAPIGAFVTVDTATEKTIAVSASIELNAGYTLETAKSEIDALLENYFSSISFIKTQVNYMTVGSVILGNSSVASLNDLKINGGTADIILSGNQIPILGTTEWTVATNE